MANQDNRDARFVLSIAVVLGAWTGLVEGAALVGLQELKWLTWEVSRIGFGLPQIWVSAVFDLGVFLLVALGLIVLGRLASRLPLGAIAIFCLCLLMFSAWLMLAGWISMKACVMMAAGLAAVSTRFYRRRQERSAAFFRRMTPWSLAAVVFAVLAIEGGGWLEERWATSGRAQPAPGSPNVLVIVLDTLRADHLSALGYSRQTSPHIDRLAQEGMILENGVATSSWTLPSHVSMLTGRPAESLEGPAVLRDPGTAVLGELLQSRGYRTGAFSANLYYFTRSHDFGRGFDHFSDFYQSLPDMAARTVFGQWAVRKMLQWGVEDRPGRKSADQVNHEFLPWALRDPERPFFAFLNYFDAHDPYLPPAPFRGKFSTVPNPGGIVNSQHGRSFLKLSPEQLQSEIDAYDGAIAYIDDRIGQLLEELSKSGQLQNTVLLLVSDHGESFGEHNLTGHQTSLYWDLLRVPIILWAPGRVSAGVRVTQPIPLAALPATAMEFVDAGKSPAFPTPSISSLLKVADGEAAQYPVSTLAHLPFGPMRGTPVFEGAIKSMVSPQWHYIYHEKLGEELYDWKVDPREENNLASQPEGQPVCQEFMRRMRRLFDLPPPDSAASHLKPAR